MCQEEVAPYWYLTAAGGTSASLCLYQLDIHQPPTPAEVQEDRCTLRNKSTRVSLPLCHFSQTSSHLLG